MTQTKVIIEVLTADVSDDVIQAACTACVSAFSTDRLVTTCFLNGYDGVLKQPSLAEELHTAVIRSAIVKGRVYIAKLASDEATGAVGEETGKIVGAAIWSPPGVAFLSTEAQRGVGWDKFMEHLEALNPSAMEWWKYFFTLKRVFEKDVLLASWWLNWFGVHKDYQGRGIGSAMLARAREDALSDPEATEDNLKMCLNTNSTQNVKFYESNGFHLAGTVDMFGSKEYGEELFISYSCQAKIEAKSE